MNKKSNFEEALEISLNKWVASISEDSPLPEPSEAYKKAIKDLFGIDIDKQ